LFLPSPIVKHSETGCLAFESRASRATINDVRWTKKLLYLPVAYALAFALTYVIPSFIHRRNFDRAFFAWYKNPTPENTSALRIQQHKNDLIHLEDSAIAALVLLVVFCGIYGGLRLGKQYSAGSKRSETR
jgi:hypothetical protein